jgi:hypothetical protein
MVEIVSKDRYAPTIATAGLLFFQAAVVPNHTVTPAMIKTKLKAMNAHVESPPVSNLPPRKK